MSTQDSASFLAFLQELRNDSFGAQLILTAAAVLPFYGPDGQPSKDVAGFGAVLDWVTIMNYDIWGSWNSVVGPNSPLDDSCAVPADQMGSAVSAVEVWQQAGMELHQIVLGVAAYGHSFQVKDADAYNGSSLALYPPFDKTNQPVGDAWDDDAVGRDVCGNLVGSGGTIRFWGLIGLGYLHPDGTPRDGIDYAFDECSRTVINQPVKRRILMTDTAVQAYVYNKTSEIMVSYDDAKVTYHLGVKYFVKMIFNRRSQTKGVS
jgi:chitinase